jgi:capsular polysaccharide transport system ATP-binding protein
MPETSALQQIEPQTSRIIELRNVTKRVVKNGEWLYIAREINMKVARGDRIAILGTRRSGKTTLLRFLCGTEQADTGEIIRDIRASWPIPTASFFAPQLTAAINIRFIARLFERDIAEYTERVKELAEIGRYINQPLSTLNQLGRQQLAFALGVSMDFDIYLFDDVVEVGPPAFRKKCAEIVEQLAQSRGVVIATGSLPVARQYCEQAYVLDEGHAFHYFDMNQAASHFRDVYLRTRAANESEDMADNLIVR